MIQFDDHTFFSTENTPEVCAVQEREQFTRFQNFPYPDYFVQRLTFLQKQKHAGFSVQWLKTFRPSIGVFAGSFNPFHKGHYNVLQKAEHIFDKVIVAFGQNPEKKSHQHRVPKTISNRQIAEYDGLLTDFVALLGHPVIVIRGLRNSTDFQYEQNQYRYIQELMPDIRIVSIFCDKEYEHISSSGIRTLEKFGRHTNYLLE